MLNLLIENQISIDFKKETIDNTVHLGTTKPVLLDCSLKSYLEMLDLQCLFWTMPGDTVLTAQTVQCSGVLKNKMYIILQLKNNSLWFHHDVSSGNKAGATNL